MKLSDMAVRAAKPRAKAFKLADGAGMYLLVKPDGKKLLAFRLSVSRKAQNACIGSLSRSVFKRRPQKA